MPCFTDTSLLLKTTFWPLDGFRLFVSLGSCLNQVYPTSPFIQTYCKANKMKWCKFHRILFYFKFIHFFNLKVLFFFLQWSIRIMNSIAVEVLLPSILIWRLQISDLLSPLCVPTPPVKLHLQHSIDSILYIQMQANTNMMCLH